MMTPMYTAQAKAEAGRDGYLVVAESVPGGTTTALSLLCGLGIDVRHATEAVRAKPEAQA